MNRICICLGIAIFLLFAGAAEAEPLDRNAYDILKMAEVARKAGRQLSSEKVQKILEMIKPYKLAGDACMAAAYAMIFTDSDEGKKTLAALAASRYENVAGVAEYAILRKNISHLRGQELLAVVAFHLGQSKRPWTRTLLVTWLGDEFQQAVLPLFLNMLEREEEWLVRCELIFQILSYGNKAQLEKAQALLEEKSSETNKKQHEEVFYEPLGGILDRVSSAPRKRPKSPLRECIKLRLNELKEKEKPLPPASQSSKAEH